MREMRESDEWMTVDAGYQAGRKGQIKMTLAALQPVRDALWGLHDDLKYKVEKFKELAGKAAALHNLMEYGQLMAKANSLNATRQRLAAILGEREG